MNYAECARKFYNPKYTHLYFNLVRLLMIDFSYDIVFTKSYTPR